MSKIATRFLALFLTLAMLLPNLLPVSAAEMTGQSAAVQSSEEANKGTPSEGTPEGTPAGKSEGSSEGTPAGGSEGSSKGTPAGGSEGSSEGTPAGSSEGSSKGTPAGSSEGSSEGTPAGGSEGSSKGTPAGNSEGSSEGTPAGGSEGSSERTPAGGSEGSSEGTPAGSSEGSSKGTLGSSEGSSEGTPGEDVEKDSEDDSNENPVTHSEITSLTFDAAPEPEQPVDGLIAVASGTDTASTYFTVKSATAIRVGERLYATLTVDTAYTYLYFGAKSTLDALLAAGEPVSALASPFHFTSSAADHSRLTVCALKADETSETGYAILELDLIIPEIPVPAAKEPVPVPTPVSYGKAPSDERDVSGKLYVASQGSTDPYAQFEIKSATAWKTKDTIYVTVQVSRTSDGEFAYDYLYFGNTEALEAQLKVDGAFNVVGGVNGSETQSYHFTLPVSAAGNRVPVCVLKKDSDFSHNSSELELIVPADIPEAATPKPASYDSAPTDEQDMTGKLYVHKVGETDPDKEIYSMFAAGKATAVKDDNQIYITLHINPAGSGKFTYSYLYFGTLTALKEQLTQDGPFDVVGGISGERQVYHFTLPLSAEGTRIPVCTLKSDLTARTPYNSSELELVVPTGISKVAPQPTPKNYATAPVDEKDMSGKLFVASAGADKIYSMFNAVSATAIKDDSHIYLTLYVSPNSKGVFLYNYLYLDTLSNLNAQLEKIERFDVVGGEINAAGKQVYHLTLPVTAEGKRIPVCVIKSNLGHNSGNLELVIPSDIPKAAPQPAAKSYPDAPSDEQDMQGSLFVAKKNESTNYSMFDADTATAVKDKDHVYVTLHVKPNADGTFPYNYLYLGNLDALSAQLDKIERFDVVGSTIDSNNRQVYHFTLPVSAEGSRIPVSLIAEDLARNSDELELVIPSNIPKIVAQPKPGTYSAAPSAEQDVTGKLFVAKANDSVSYAAFDADSATAVKDESYIYVTLHVKPDADGNFPYSYLYFGNLDELNAAFDNGGSFEVVGGETDAAAGRQVYHFTLPVPAEGSRISVSLIAKDLTHNSDALELVVPADIPECPPAPKPEPAPAISKLPDNLSEAGIKVVKAGGTEFKMFAASKTGMVIAGDKLLIHFETGNTNFDKLYFGSKDDDFKSPYVQGTARTGGGWVFEFELPASYRGQSNPVCLGKPDGSWYAKADLLISIPGNTGDTANVIDNAAMKMLAGGSEVEQSFVITSSTATLVGDTITCTITGTPRNQTGKSSYKLYLGSRDDKDKSSSIPGTINEDGTVTFRFTVPADKQGVCIPAVLGYDSSWDTTQDYFLNIPNFDRKFSMDYYTDGEYDLFGNAYSEQQRTANRSFPIDSQSTLTVSGDKIILKWVCRSKTYDKLYFGTLADGEDAWNAGAISYADYTDIGTSYNYKVFYITLPKSALGTRIPFLRHNSKGWVKTQDYLILTDYLPRLSSTPVDPGPEPTPGEGIADGTYNTTGETGVNMFKVVKAVLTAKNGKYQVTLTRSGTGYDYLCVGSAGDAPNKKDSWVPAKIVNCTINGETRDFYTYTFDVDDPTKPIAIASHSQKNDKWYDRTVTLNTTDLKRTAPDGSYTVTAECSASMFKIVSAKLVSVNGEMKAVLTLSGTGYDYLYPGTGEQAAKDKDNRVPFQTDADGKYTYTIPVSELDKPLTISSHSKKNDIWYDRVVTFLSSSLTKTGEVVTPDPGKDPTKPPDPEKPTDPEKPDDESQHEPDTSGSTTKVNNGTTLKDGVYTPDKFSFSGGSGRARIVCDKVTVKNGKAFATIRFVSTSGSPTAYSYVKASGNKYYSTGVSTFTIPVALNQNNRILGMTTKMSAAHEIEYTIYIQLKEATATPNGTAAANDTDTPDPDSKLDKEAPDIMGLTYQETVKTPKSRYLRMFRYDQGVTLVEIDLTRDTVLDTDEARAAIAKADKEAQTDSTADIAVSDEPADTAQIASDYTAALYRADVLKYLLVPEKADLPAGLEKEYLIIRLPVSNIYLTGEEAVGTLYDLGGMDLVKLIGSEEPEYDLLEEALLEKQAAYGGGWDDPDYRAMVKAGIDFCLNDAGVLPLNEETRKERKLDAPEGETLTAVEYRDRLANVTDRFAVLGIPMLFDRSADEPEKEGQAAWIKLYGILLGQETKADKLYTSTVEG